MYARVTRYQMNPETFSEAQELAEQMRPRIKALPGIRDWMNVARQQDGTGVVIAVYDDEAAAEAAQAAAQTIWAEFAAYLVGPPKVEGYDTVMELPGG